MDPVRALGLDRGGNDLVDLLPTLQGLLCSPGMLQVLSDPAGKGGEEGLEWVVAGEHQAWESVIKRRRKGSQNLGGEDGCLGDQSCGCVLGEAERWEYAPAPLYAPPLL